MTGIGLYEVRVGVNNRGTLASRMFAWTPLHCPGCTIAPHQGHVDLAVHFTRPIIATLERGFPPLAEIGSLDRGGRPRDRRGAGTARDHMLVAVRTMPDIALDAEGDAERFERLLEPRP